MVVNRVNVTFWISTRIENKQYRYNGESHRYGTQRQGLGDAGVFIAYPARPILYAIKVQSNCFHTPRLRSRVARLLPGHALKLKTQVSSAPGIAKPHVGRRFTPLVLAHLIKVPMSVFCRPIHKSRRTCL